MVCLGWSGSGGLGGLRERDRGGRGGEVEDMA